MGWGRSRSAARAGFPWPKAEVAVEAGTQREGKLQDKEGIMDSAWLGKQKEKRCCNSNDSPSTQPTPLSPHPQRQHPSCKVCRNPSQMRAHWQVKWAAEEAGDLGP